MGDGLLYRRMHHSLVGGQVELDPGQATPRLHRPAVVNTAFYLETIPRVSEHPEPGLLGRDVYPTMVIHPFRNLLKCIH